MQAHSMLSKAFHGTRLVALVPRPLVVLPSRGGVCWAVAYRRRNPELRRTTPPRPHVAAQPPAQPPATPPSQPSLLASGGMLAGLVLLLGGVYLGREQINEFVEFFIAMVESYGAWGYVTYAVVYFLLVRT